MSEPSDCRRELLLPWRPTPEWVQRDFDRLHAGDPVGRRAHLFFGCTLCVSLGLDNTAIEICSGVLLGVFLVRLWWTWRILPYVFMQPFVLAGLVYLAWTALTLLWTSNLQSGLIELGNQRWFFLIVLLAPVIEHRRLLIGMLILGYLIGLGVQGADVIGNVAGIEWLDRPGAADRMAGWWGPVHGGMLLTACLGLHLPAAVMGGGWTRIAGAMGSLVSMLGIFATGSRGAWLAGLGLVVLTPFIALAAIRPRARAVRVAVVFAVFAGVGGGVIALTLGDAVVRRVDAARGEIARAMETGDYASDTGARILMGFAALDLIREHPVAGAGIGSFRTELVVYRDEHAPNTPDWRIAHEHAHNALLQIGATTGLVGVGLASVLFVLALAGGFHGLWPRLGTYDAGPAFALLGLMLAGATEVIQTQAAFWLIAALCIGARPAHRTLWRHR